VLFSTRSASNNPTHLLTRRHILVTVALALGLIASVFYWYEWRPTRTRHGCDLYARDSLNFFIAGRTASPSEQRATYQAEYTRCLHQNGL